MDAVHVSETHKITNDEGYILSLAKYEFMVNAKEVAEQGYKAKIKELSENQLTTCSVAIEEYQSERNEVLRQKIASDQVQTRNANLEELDNLIITLREYNDNLQVDIEEHDVPIATSSNELEPLIVGDRVDESYTGSVIELTTENRELLERLVMGESGNQGFVGAALVAQTIHDTMLLDNCYDVMTIKQTHEYSGKLDTEPNEDVKKACALIFDDGGMAVKHQLVYFYAPGLVESEFHESQKFVVQYKGHRFFDRWE